MVEHNEIRHDPDDPVPGGRALNVLFLVRSDAEGALLAGVLGSSKRVACQVLSRGSWPVDRDIMGVVHPDVLVVTGSGADEDFEFVRALKSSVDDPFPTVLLLDQKNDNGDQRAHLAGADEIVFKPLDAKEFENALVRAASGQSVHSRGPVSDRQLVIFMHVSGGAGATTLAVNSAYSLAKTRGFTNTCLVDLDVQFGSVGDVLELPHLSPIEEFIEDPARLDMALLDGMLVRHASGLNVLTAPRTPLPLDGLSPPAVAALFAVLKRRFRGIVVDMPVALAPWTDTVMQMAAVIYLVTPLTVPAAHRVRKLLELLRQENLLHLPLKLVANRYNSSAKGSPRVNAARFSEAVGFPVSHSIPNDYGLASRSETQGSPALVLKPRSGFSAAVDKMLASDLQIGAESKNQSAGRSRLFSL